MKKIRIPIVLLFVLVLGFAKAYAQDGDGADMETFSLITVFDYSSEPPRMRKNRNAGCIDLAELVQRCGTKVGLMYGERFGVNWDIFQIVGKQTRMVRIGEYELTDDFDIPEVTPWAKLEPGDIRTLNIDGSGSGGEHGKTADGTLVDVPPRREGGANKPVREQVSATIKRADGTVVQDNYNPYMQVKKGYVYAVRAFDRNVDEYFLIRVDDLQCGESAIVTVKRVDGPTRKEEE